MSAFDHLPPKILHDDESRGEQVRDLMLEIAKFAALVFALPGVFIVVMTVGHLIGRAG